MKTHIHVNGLKEKTVKMSILSKLICLFNRFPIKMLVNFFVVMGKLLKFMWYGKGTS